MTDKKKLTTEHYVELLAIERGADVMGHYSAKLLREIEATEPSFIKILPYKGEYKGCEQLPYFGAIATLKGRNQVNKYFSSI